MGRQLKMSTPSEGAVFLVPLEPFGYATGVLARGDGYGRAFGYFFGPRLERKDQIVVESLRADLALLVCKFGDHHLFEGKWPLIGRIPDWTRVRWKLPLFTRSHDRSDSCYLVEYSDSLDVVSERVVLRGSPEAQGLPYDSQIGSGNVALNLSKLLPVHQ